MSKNIYQRINAVMKEVAYVQKDASVSTGGGSYRAVTHDMVLAVLRKAMVANGIVVRVEQLRSGILQFADKDKGIKQHLYSGDYAVHFHNMDEPADCLTVTVNGHAADNQDKAPGKAMSYAVKYAMLKTFGLETGENEEGRFSEPFTAEQLAVYHDLLENDKAYEFYLFTAALPPETTTGLVNSFPDGKKTQGKKKAGQLEQEGNAKFLETVEEVQTRIANHDISVTEITDEMSAIEKRLLISRLSKYEVDQLSKIKQAETAA
jgi:hypothetical protein